MTYSQINPTKVGGFLLLIGLVLLVGCQKEEPQQCNVVIYSNGTIIFTLESCSPNYIYLEFPLDEIPDNATIENATLTLY